MPSASPVIWILGLSGAGKSTLAKALQEELISRNLRVEVMDGDVMRAKTGNTNFSRENRMAHLKQMADLASDTANKGIIVIAAFITPYEEARSYARQKCDHYIEVWVDTSLEECEKRDVKGLYAKARKGEIPNFTGISDKFEVPRSHDIHLKTEKSIRETMLEFLEKLKGIGIVL
jgi:adenylylsulfate kinase